DGHAEQASCGNLRKAQIDDAPREHEVDVFLLIRVPSSETQRHSLGDGIGRIEIERSAARVYLSDCGRGGTCKRRPERREGTAKRGQHYANLAAYHGLSLGGGALLIKVDAGNILQRPPAGR